jgi:hypothetical protein
MQRVRVNVLVNDVVPCSNYTLQIVSILDPTTQGTASVQPGGYIEFMPCLSCRNVDVAIGYKISCATNEASATLSVRVGEYNNPANVIDSDITCYDLMPGSISFGIKEKFKTEGGAPASEYCIDGFTSPLVGDLNGDGKPEIVMLGTDGAYGNNYDRRGRYINIYNGQNGSRMYRFELSSLGTGYGDFPQANPYHRSPSVLALADLDNDGIGEIVVCNSNSGYIYA